MPLAKRIIPCLDVQDGRVVKGISFAGLIDAGDAAGLAARYDAEGADELAFLDIAATREGRRTFTGLLSRVADRVFIPLTAGGGVTSADDAGRLLRAGADKVTVNTAAVSSPHLLSEIAERFGRQCVVLAVDAASRGPDRWEVFTHGGTRPTGLDAVEWAARAAALGAGEILLTSIDQDGRQGGYDLRLTRVVAEAVGVPVIASGGAGSPSDVVSVLGAGGADAALLASLLHFRQATIAQLKTAMAAAGLPVRPEPRLGTGGAVV
ncbi:MAG: imidazole glycerol phosphate synthase subunit HisF [Bacillota bacterium]|nr:imidazole glycerol phosphate synthase subunit HisF [Bacillota bacterium]